ncbi:helix-turn-helix transcriptional regulator [Chitinophaga dinghuensis]|nr:helix-turn-helix transcriptional regulator [Chitinophaga dinghuensis]
MADKLKLNRIKVVLAEKEIEQKVLAGMVKRDYNTINRICNNTSQPTLKLLYQIALALDVSVCDLLVDSKTVRLNVDGSFSK